jgi:Flp pilus assembly protein TadD
VDEAVRLLHRAIEAEPHDEARHVHLAGLLASQGRVGSARAILGQARAALAEMDLDPSESLLSVERSLDRPV